VALLGGDFQDRFTRDYILLVTNGQLAGTWPVLLGDHGQAGERSVDAAHIRRRVARTRDLGAGWDPIWAKLRDPIFKLTRRDDVKVYRYWDDDPQPIATGNADLPGIVFSLPGQEAVYLVTSYSSKDEQVRITIDPKALGFTGAYKVVDIETGQDVPLTDNVMTFPLKKHDLREMRITPQ